MKLSLITALFAFSGPLVSGQEQGDAAGDSLSVERRCAGGCSQKDTTSSTTTIFTTVTVNMKDACSASAFASASTSTSSTSTLPIETSTMVGATKTTTVHLAPSPVTLTIPPASSATSFSAPANSSLQSLIPPIISSFIGTGASDLSTSTLSNCSGTVTITVPGGNISISGASNTSTTHHFPSLSTGMLSTSTVGGVGGTSSPIPVSAGHVDAVNMQLFMGALGLLAVSMVSVF